MKILDYLEKVQNYPEHKRRQILLVSSVTITLVIVLLWGLNFWLLSNSSNINIIKKASLSDKIMAEFDNIKIGVTAIGEKLKSLWR